MSVEIREVTALPTLMRWRAEVIGHVFGEEPSPRLLVANRRYYQENVASGRHIAVVAEADGCDAGCGALCLHDELPSPDNPSGRCAYLMNIYVRLGHRGRGVGHAIVRWLVAKARQLGCEKIYLETTDAARALYKSIGFENLTGYMRYDFHDTES